MTCDTLPAHSPSAESSSSADSQAASPAAHQPSSTPTQNATHVIMDAVRTWSGVSIAPLRGCALDVQFDGKRLGRIHLSGTVSVAFPAALRDVLVQEELAAPHRFHPDSGWVSVSLQAWTADVTPEAAREDESVRRATFVLRLAYIYRALVRSCTTDERDAVRAELDALHVSGPLRDAFDALLSRA